MSGELWVDDTYWVIFSLALSFGYLWMVISLPFSMFIPSICILSSFLFLSRCFILFLCQSNLSIYLFISMILLLLWFLGGGLENFYKFFTLSIHFFCDCLISFQARSRDDFVLWGIFEVFLFPKD